jgi:hypothetical protein
MATFEEVEQNLPCPDRRGIGWRGCKCKNGVQDSAYVDCAAYGSPSISADNCENCPFRLAHVQNKRVLKG